MNASCVRFQGEASVEDWVVMARHRGIRAILCFHGMSPFRGYSCAATHLLLSILPFFFLFYFKEGILEQYWCTFEKKKKNTLLQNGKGIVVVESSVGFVFFFLSYISGAGFPQGNARSIGSYALTGDKDVLFYYKLCIINYGKSLWRDTCRHFFFFDSVRLFNLTWNFC